MASQAETLKGELATERSLRKSAELSKRAETEFEGLPGTTAEKVEMLKAIDAMPEAAQKSVIDALANAQKIGTLALSNMGANARGSVHKVRGNDSTGFEKRIGEVRQVEKCGRAQAMRIARKQYPDEYAAWQGSNGTQQ
jgi:hypothetical protein